MERDRIDILTAKVKALHAGSGAWASNARVLLASVNARARAKVKLYFLRACARARRSKGIKR